MPRKPPPPTRFGALLHLKRLDAGLRFAAYGRKLDVDPMTVDRWERGNPPDASNFIRVCGLLGLEPTPDLLEEPIEDEDLEGYFRRPRTQQGVVLTQLREDLASIIATDKTLSYMPGEPNALGKAPDEGASWLTPRQLAQNGLTRIDGVTGDAQHGADGA